MPKFTETEWVAIQRALEIAIRQYESDAHDADCHPNHERIAQSFRDCQKVARSIHEKIEDFVYA